MHKNEKQLLKTAAIFYLILIILIYLGSYLKYLLQYSWYGTASVIVIIFIWITLLLAATVIMARAIFLIRKHKEPRQKIDFTARLGAYIADYSQSDQNPNLKEFFKKACKEIGVENPPSFEKYYDSRKKLLEKRDLVYLKLKEEIKDAVKAVPKKTVGQ
jgi:hypothetical protein